VICFLSAVGMLRGGVCCGVAVAAWLEIGRSLTTASLLVASAAACDDAGLQTATNMETATMD